MSEKKILDEKFVRELSAYKNEPGWMLDLRLESLRIFNEMPLPKWGPNLSKLDIDKIRHYVAPKTGASDDWAKVPDEMRAVFERLGIPEAEHKALAGAGAQYDSELVYHNLKESFARQGVIYADMGDAVREHEDLVRPLFMQLIKNRDHKFAALHGAVWSGGSFVHVPAGVNLTMPLQSYFWLEAAGAGQFEHTLIVVEPGAKLHFIEGCSAPRYKEYSLHVGAVELFVDEGATLRYSTIENWPKNMLNLNTKRAKVEKNGTIEWVSGTFGSDTTMLYPASLLVGEGAKSSFVGVSLAGEGQNLDTGNKVYHLAPNTSSVIDSKSICQNGGVATYRSDIKIAAEASGSKSSVICESLILDSKSRSDTIPRTEIQNNSSDVGHEAKIGKISDAAIFYLMTRGLSENEAKDLVVRGFLSPMTKELPLEYAVEMNRLIAMELEGAIG